MKCLIGNHAIKAGFFDHSTYESRGKLAALRQENEVFVAANGVFIKFKRELDHSYQRPSQHCLDLVSKSNLCDWSTKRLAGFSSNEEAAKAFLGSTESRAFVCPENIVFLHVFGDSPFYNIDSSRCFRDYQEWIIATINILSLSSSRWGLKVHPSCEEWGEDSLKVLEQLLGKNIDDLPENIVIVPSGFPGARILNHVKRIVTFHGTIHLEAGCAGIKPIVISSTALGSLDPSAVFKPLHYTDYARMLLCPAEGEKFKLSAKQIDLSSKILYFLEELGSFKSSVGGRTIYRNSSDQSILDELEAVKSSVAGHRDTLNQLGELLGNGTIERTFSFDVIPKLLTEA